MEQKKTLILCSTHGDEGFSIPVVKKLSERYPFDWIIGNPKALKTNSRFCDYDLNRAAPGNLRSRLYEKRRAASIIQLAKKYSSVIDIHGTISQTGIFIILSDPTWKNIELAKQFSIKNVVLWPSLLKTGPLTQFIPSSLKIECGTKNAAKTKADLGKILVNYFESKNSNNKQYFIVSGKYNGKPQKPLYDFEKYCDKEEAFYPLMVGQYQSIKCYKMQKLNDTL